jgi:hypothetical protein
MAYFVIECYCLWQFFFFIFLAGEKAGGLPLEEIIYGVADSKRKRRQGNKSTFLFGTQQEIFIYTYTFFLKYSNFFLFTKPLCVAIDPRRLPCRNPN